MTDWTDLAKHFRATSWESTQALADLCDYIAARPVHENLHGAIAQDTLTITHPAHPDARLEIAPSQRGPIQVRYTSLQKPETMWRRHEPPEKVLDRFRRTMLLMEWVTDPAALD